MADTFKIQSYSKGQLCLFYRIDLQMLYKWLVVAGKLFSEDDYKSKRIFTPAEVSKIVRHLGEPGED